MKSQLVQELETALNNDNYSKALQAGQQLIANYPNDADSYLLTGEVFSGMENWGKAIEHYEKALSISPNDANAYFLLGDAYEQKDDFQSARQQYQIARKLEPTNSIFTGHYGRLLHENGRKTGNINLTTEGRQIMESVVQAGDAEKIIREQLAIAYLDDRYATWRQHPEQHDMYVPTESIHLDHTKKQLAKAKTLIDNSNPSINKVVQETENLLAELEKRKFFGYNILIKAPIVFGVLFMLFGGTFFGVLLLVMAGLYYASQFKPKFMENRIHFNQDYREPFVIRRINAVAEDFGGFTFFGSLTDIFFMRFAFKFAFGVVSYLMALVMLPYEIFKGFWVNYDLQHKMVAKTAA